ncbi:hypothetical protein C1I63_13845 [Rathayibacter caricis DSM 15933]|uniref:Uncharacterized protein n=1 Tax=Rathayibacter caricis DSM 15933 TaxID=1328867 RepID=A0A2T4UWA3_9MICO|nr:hypothetical protein [Rathayibacter caricis]PTL73812.1 hypothetical protein C1I63_13845 [Rathayibacter caricis DSM 15933]
MTAAKSKPTSVRDVAYSLIPGWDIRNGIMRQLGVSVLLPAGSPARATLTRPAAVATVEQKIEALLLAGKPVPDDIAAPIIEADRIDALAVARMHALNSVASNYSDTRGLLNEYTTEAAFAYLAGELATLADKVRAEANNLAGITSPATAILGNSEAITSWQTVTALEPRYREIRQVQTELMDAAFDQSSTTLSTDQIAHSAHFRRSADVVPHWIERRREAAREIPTSSRPNLLEYREWLVSGTASPVFDKDIDSTYRLVLACTDLEPWVPTFEEFDQERAAAEYITGAPTPNTIEHKTQARDAYLTGGPAPEAEPFRIMPSDLNRRSEAHARARMRSGYRP